MARRMLVNRHWVRTPCWEMRIKRPSEVSSFRGPRLVWGYFFGLLAGLGPFFGLRLCFRSSASITRKSAALLALPLCALAGSRRIAMGCFGMRGECILVERGLQDD